MAEVRERTDVAFRQEAGAEEQQVEPAHHQEPAAGRPLGRDLSHGGKSVMVANLSHVHCRAQLCQVQSCRAANPSSENCRKAVRC